MEEFHIDAELRSLIYEASEEDLQALVELHEDPVSDEQIELYIYLRLLLFRKSHRTQHLEHAIQRAKEWTAATPAAHLDYDRRDNIVEKISVWRCQYMAIKEDTQAIGTPPIIWNTGELVREMTYIQTSYLNNSAITLLTNFKNNGCLQVLNKAIEDMELALNIAWDDTRPVMLHNLGAMLGMRFRQTGLMIDLSRAINVANKAIDATPRNHPDRASFLNNLGVSLNMRFQRTGSLVDLDRAVTIASEAVDTTPHSHPDRAARISNLANWVGVRFERAGSMDDLNRAVNLASEAVDATLHDDPDRAACLSSLGNWLGTRFQRVGLIDDLDRAISVTSEAVDATPRNYPDRAGRLNNLGTWLGKRFRRMVEMDDLNRAVDVASKAVDATPPGHPNRAGYLSNFGNMLDLRFQQIGLMGDLHQALSMTIEAADATPHDHPDRAGHLNNLGSMLKRKFEQTGSIDDLDRAVEVAREAVDVSPHDHPDRAGHLQNLGEWLGTRFDRKGAIEDLNQAIENVSEAVGATPRNHPDCAGRLNSLGIWLGTRFQRTGITDDLDRAIIITSEAVDATPHDHPDRASRLNNLGNLLGSRFRRMGSIDDLNRAVDLVSEAVDATLHDNSDRAAGLSSLGNWLGTRSQRTGLLRDLNQAVSAASEAVNAIPREHPYRAACLNNLGNWLRARFERTGSIDDLNRAVSIASEAVDATPHDHPDRASRLDNLGNGLGRRFDRTGSIDDLNRAVEVARAAVDATPGDHPDRANRLNNFGTWLNMQFHRTGSMDSLNLAVHVAAEAVDTTPHDHPDRASHLNNLGSGLGARFQQAGLVDDLNQAISVACEAVNATPHDDPDRAGRLNNLGNWLGTRFDRTGSIDDLNGAIDVASEAVDATPYDNPAHAGLLKNLGRLLVGIALPHPHLYAFNPTQSAAGLLISQQNWEKSYQLLKDAVSLLPTVSPRSLQQTDSQALLTQFFGLASLAAAAALSAGKAPEDALRLLEQGRGVIASLLTDMRGDRTDLQLQHPDLAEKFKLLRDELDLPSQNAISLISVDKMSSWELQVKRRRDADRELNEVINIIRAQPGFSSFLHPPAREELMSAADQGPIIVVNISSYRCDAFLVRSSSIQVVELPGITQDGLIEQFAYIRHKLSLLSSLEWLWHNISRPCLDALNLTDSISDDNWPRVWWIPTGLLSQMPLHAAGIYKVASKETVLDRTISSYASSIKALLHGRRYGVNRSSRPFQENSALMVAMGETPGFGEIGRLHFASDEVEMLKQICSQLQLAPNQPPPRKKEILKHLPKCSLFHFAGHGQSHQTDPSRSCLLLEDWETNPLTVGDIRNSQLQDNPPFLAYLSACSTGANETLTLCDEGIHLISAFQLAGFRHVVGTLWEVSDKHCVDVARILYKTLQEEGITDIAVSRGLHRAVRALRNGKAEEETQGRDAKLAHPKPAVKGVMDFFWIPYVHFGV